MQTKSIGYPSLFSSLIHIRPIARRRSLIARIVRAVLGGK
jgi:hypothetical protein